ncbi:hypothetical protein CCR96_18490 [Halochromatium roseum]|nr:hypothetical protein [Halochromatium roseum]
MRLIQADPNKARLDRLITRWLKRHLQRLGAQIDLTQINSLVEDKAMLAENRQHWAEREREEGHKEGRQEGLEEGRQQANRETALQLISIGLLKDSQIPQATGLSLAQIEALRSQPPS